MHHLYQNTGIVNGAIGFILQCLGYLSVGMFFFYTGYGLMISSWKINYINGFIRKRIVPLYSFYSCLVMIYSLYRILIGNYFTLNEFVQSFLFGKTIVPLAWYLQVTFFIYIIFYVVFKTFVKDKNRLCGLIISVILYCVICYVCKLSSTWYESIACVILGMMWGYKKDQIDAIIEQKSVVITITSFILFVICVVVSRKLGIIPKMFSVIFFAICVTAFSYFVVNTRLINNKITQWLGRYSFEIYMS